MSTISLKACNNSELSESHCYSFLQQEGCISGLLPVSMSKLRNSIGHINKELEIFVRAVMWRNPVRNAGSWPGTPTTMGTLIILTLEQFFRRRFNINRCCPVVVIIMNNHSNILTFLDSIEGLKSKRHI